ncbi:glycosyltransferase [Pedobacter sp. Leaf250]|uniref:glycosyltransferase n=1 Tax=Pedobacter sp. Leaf250 TaxID=2876559 RepID=UPI001E5B74E8|nr:glycosyltransferase [Pedobacter sp. Leaf250]
MENLDIIIVGQQGWDTEIGSNCKNIAEEFSKNNRVLYVNPPLDRITRWREPDSDLVKSKMSVISGDKPVLNQVKDNLYVLDCDCLIESINWLPSGWLYNRLNKLNNKRIFTAVNRAIEHINFKVDVLFNDSDMFRSFHLKALLKPKLSIYYSRDNMLATSYYKKHGSKLEPQIIAQSDLCFTNSKYLESYCRKYNANSFNVGQGCDFALFDAFELNPVVAKLDNIPHPRIGYVGVLTSARLDISIINDIAEAKPEWSIVLVGPEDATFQESKLHQKANIHFIGAQPVTELPNYINEFDVCFNPQLMNDLTIGNYPRKIDEYLALGKPTIATKTEAMEPFNHHVVLADGVESYINGIQKLLNEHSEVSASERKSFARSHTWGNSVALMYRFIKKTKISLYENR